MHRVLIALALATAALASCKDKSSDQFAAQDVKLEVYQRAAQPTRAAMRSTPPKWLETPPACPTEVLPARFVDAGFDLEDCAGPKLDACLDRCKNSDVAACYSSALILQGGEEDEEKAVATPVFARACQLGSASACTNWAAALGEITPGNLECARSTFQATCERGRDPWGCTMYGYILADEGLDEATTTNLRSLIPIACTYGEDDPACQSMRKLVADADSALQKFSDAGPS